MTDIGISMKKKAAVIRMAWIGLDWIRNGDWSWKLDTLFLVFLFVPFVFIRWLFLFTYFPILSMFRILFCYFFLFFLFRLHPASRITIDTLLAYD